jgi:hypothetical protein
VWEDMSKTRASPHCVVTNDFVPSLDGSVCGVVDVPSWAVEWCTEVLGVTPVEQLFVSDGIAEVRAVRLDDGRAVVLKARVADDAGERVVALRLSGCWPSRASRARVLCRR